MIEVNALSKRFDTGLAVDHLSFSVGPGEVLGFLGPNGAGKSTTMKMITGFLRPTSGSVIINGFDVQTHPLEAKRQIGYLPEGAPGYGEMSVWQFLEFIADIRGLKGQQREQRLQSVIQDVHLSEVLQQRIETLSKGYRRRAGLAQAIVHDPKVLILDEPTDGLDPNQKHEVRNLIRGMASDKIIIISTHILEEVEAVCSRAMIIGHGRLLVDSTPDELVARSKYHGAVNISLPGFASVVDEIRSIPQVAEVEVNEKDSEIVVIPKNGSVILPSISRLIEQHDWQVNSLYLQRGRLNEVFRDITGGAEA
jgi:ABC-2 type transport system ATP-binding protein